MIPSPKEKDFRAKQEGESKVSPRAAASSSSRQWSAFRNPRIVRVSRSFGGKDRHSKVCTVRGLRDRRIRLSVPTAIQLYDLQDRLQLNQPSKVIDWLLDATKNDIDNLPPLQIPQGFGAQFQQPMLVNSHESSHAPSQSSLSPLFDANSLEKGKWIKTNEQENLNFFPLASSHSSMPGLVNNPLPFNPYYHWDASNLSLSQFGSHGFLSQSENSINNNIPSSQLALSSSGSQLFFCPPPAATMPSLFPAYPPYVTTAVENDHHSRELNHFQLLTSSSQHMLPSSRVMRSPTKPFQLINISPGLLHLQGNEKSNAGDQDDTDS